MFTLQRNLVRLLDIGFNIMINCTTVIYIMMVLQIRPGSLLNIELIIIITCATVMYILYYREILNILS